MAQVPGEMVRGGVCFGDRDRFAFGSVHFLLTTWRHAHKRASPKNYGFANFRQKRRVKRASGELAWPRVKNKCQLED